MSVAVNFAINDYATPAIEKAVAAVAPAKLAALVRSPLETFWRNRLRSLGPNKRGWPSTRFYERAARSVTGITTADGVVLRADHQGLRQRWKGGPILPVNKDALAIPISPVSYGRTPAEFPGLFLMRTRKGAYLVQSGETLTATGRLTGVKSAGGAAARRQRASLNFLFKLSSGVNQKGNPAVVPTDDEFAEVALGAIQRGLKLK